MRIRLLLSLCLISAINLSCPADAYDWFYDYRPYGGRSYKDEIRIGCNIISEEEKTVDITYENPFADITVPDSVEINGEKYTVTVIKPYAFTPKYKSGPITVTIPPTVKVIGDHAFAGSTGTERVEMPTSIEYLGRGLFTGCTGLKQVTLPENITEIGDSMFYGTALTTLHLPNTITHIGDYAFATSKIENIDIPESVVSIGDKAFYRSGLRSIAWPEGVTTISDEMFYYCKSLKTVTLPSTLSEIGNSVFNLCGSLEQINTPESLTKIGENAFQYCESLKNIYLPEGLSQIGIYAFGNSGLISVTIPSSLEQISQGAFNQCTNLQEVTFYSRVTAYDHSFSFCPALKMVDIQSDYCTFYDDSFSGSLNIESITMKSEDPSVYIGFITIPSTNSFKTNICTLYVPRQSVEKYRQDANWGQFRNIEGYVVPLKLIDGTAYDRDYDEDDSIVSYERNFGNTKWQALYLPYNLAYDEWCDYVDIAEISNVRGYDDDNDLVVDRTVIEFNRLTSGEIKANIPYVVKAKRPGLVVFESTGKNVKAAPAQEGSVECSSTRFVYSLHGVYQPKKNLCTEGAYALSGGTFCPANDDSVTLAPFRLYLKIEPSEEGYYTNTSLSKPVKVEISVDGDAASIEDISPDLFPELYYDLTGCPTPTPHRGVYVKQGKKLFIK